MDTEEVWSNRPEVKISIPSSLKVHLVDDWEAVTKNSQVRTDLVYHFLMVTRQLCGQLVPLPRSPNVQDILKAYEEEASSNAKPP